MVCINGCALYVSVGVFRQYALVYIRLVDDVQRLEIWDLDAWVLRGHKLEEQEGELFSPTGKRID